MEETKINVEVPLAQKVNQLYEQMQNTNVKSKNLKLLRRAKVRKNKIKKGWIGILRIGENKNVSGEKQYVDDMTYKLKDGTYHATDGREILFYDGKLPIVIQPSWKLNPINFNDISKTNEVYGQKYVMARMLKDAIVMKNKGGIGIIIWIAILAVIGFGIKYFFFK